jgi:hypothetical protein
MPPRSYRGLAKVLGLAIAGLLVFAATASAHYVSVKPKRAYAGSDFYFTGSQWQPSKRVRWGYDQFNDGDFDQTGRITSRSDGSFLTRWRSDDVTGTHRMCFEQFDSRKRFQKTFFKCRKFTVLPD